jgi:anti-anti-sigma factor
VDRAARGSIVVIDLTAVGFLDSLGIATLLNLHQRSRRHHVELRVVTEPGRPARRVLTLSGMETLLSIHDSVQDATAAPSSLRPTTPPPPV